MKYFQISAPLLFWRKIRNKSTFSAHLRGLLNFSIKEFFISAAASSSFGKEQRQIGTTHLVTENGSFGNLITQVIQVVGEAMPSSVARLRIPSYSALV